MGQENQEAIYYVRSVDEKSVQVYNRYDTEKNEKLPASLPITQIHGYWWVDGYSYRTRGRGYVSSECAPLVKNTKAQKRYLKILKSKNLINLEDFEDISLSYLTEKLKVSKVLATRILQCAKLADVSVRMNGYPYDINCNIKIPVELADYVKNWSPKQTSKALQNFLDDSEFFNNLKIEIGKVQRKELMEKRLEIENQLEKIRRELEKNEGVEY